MSHDTSFVVRLGDRGRLVLPAALRQHLGIRTGDEVIAFAADDGGVSLISRQGAVRRARGLLRSSAGDRSLAGELIRQRRLEAHAENDE